MSATPISSSDTFDLSHILHIKPIKRGKRAERFIFPEIREQRGTPFELCNDEERFVVDLLGDSRSGLRKHNLWLYRTDQKKRAGDFVVIDTSGPTRTRNGVPTPLWDVFVLDLKMGAPLQLGGQGAGIQLLNWSRAARVAYLNAGFRCGVAPDDPRLRRRWRALCEPRSVWRLVGDRAELVAFFRNLPLLRSTLRRTGCPRSAILPLHRHLAQCSAPSF